MDKDWESRNLQNKTAIVTGANSGLGFEAAKKLAEKHANVVMACRSKKKGHKAREKIGTEDTNIEVMEIDLASLDSIRKFAENFREKYTELDLLFNNAGLMAIPRKETEDGFEMQFGVNHLGHFALTAHLIDMLEANEESRVVTQTSLMHKNGRIDFSDINKENSYDRTQAYSDSKLANLLFAKELDRRLKREDQNVKSVAVHPGFSATHLFNGEEHERSWIYGLAMKLFTAVFAQSAEKGCLPMVHAATAESIEGGEYIGPNGFKNMRGLPEKQEPSKKAQKKDLAKKLWEKSEEMTEVDFRI